MKKHSTIAEPFSARPYYTNKEIERICSDELRSVDLFPASPATIRIDRFIEKRFGITPLYDDLPTSILAFTRFGPNGIQAMVISRVLADEGTKVSERRLNATLAHEAGHGFLHARLFLSGPPAQSLFAGEDLKSDPMRILCRDDGVSTMRPRGQTDYAGRWWEYQANRTIGALLLPALLVRQCLESFLVYRGSFGNRVISEERREGAVRLLTDIFDVNPAVARIRLSDLYPEEDERQLAL